MSRINFRRGSAAIMAAADSPWDRAPRRAVEDILDDLGVRTGRLSGAELPHQCFHAPENHTNDDGDMSASSNVETGAWFCQVCNVGGYHEGYRRGVQVAVPRERPDELPDISPEEEFEPAPSRPTPRYEYHDELGNLVFWISRGEDKKFRPHHYNEHGTAVTGLTIDRPLYRLPELIRGVADGRTVYVVEGEKDADAMADAGTVATTNVGGAGKFGRASGIEYLKGTEVVVVADRDKAGLRHALDVEKRLKGVAKSVRLAMAPVGKDAADWLWNGGDPDEWDEVPVPELARSLATAEPRLWITGADLARLDELMAPSEFIAPVMVPELAKTLFIGDSKVGKSTYLMYLVNQVARGLDFFGGPTIQSGAVYLTEQHLKMFAQQVHPGIVGLENVSVLSKQDRLGWTWSDFIAAGIERCLETDSGLLVIDTAGKFARIENNDDQDQVRAIFEDLDKAQNEGITCLISKHERKSGGDITKAPSGSHAWTAEPDHLVRIERKGNLGRHQRRMQCEGRFYEAIGEWTVEYDPDTRDLHLLGSADEVGEDAGSTLLEVKGAFGDGEEVALRELYRRLDGMNANTVRRTLSENPDVFAKGGERGTWTLVVQ